MYTHRFTRAFTVAALLSISAASVTPALVTSAFAQTVPTSGEVFNLATADDEIFKSEGATATLVGEGATKKLQAEFPGGQGYPAFVIPAPNGSWDASAFGGIQADITNNGTAPAVIALRVDNAGDWKKNPFNTESVRIAPGETKTVKVTFGKSYGGGAGFALDSSKIVALKFFAENPKATATVGISNIKAFGTAGAKAPAATIGTPVTALAPLPVAGGNVPPASGELLDLSKLDAGSFTSEGATVSLPEQGGVKTLQAEFPGGQGYPAFVVPVPQGGWNLSAFGGVQGEITNTGTTAVSVSIRVDNAGDWKKQPWNTEAIRVAPGETKTLKVNFGKSYGGNPGYALDASKVSAIKLFAENPKATTTITLKGLKAFGKPQAGAAPVATTTTTAATTGGAVNLNAPPISGEILPLSDKFDLGTLKPNQTSAALVTDAGVAALKVDFLAGDQMYPSLQFPVPQGGWNLSAFGGIQADITNPGTTPIRVMMRADNSGNWKDNPWNTQGLTVPAGTTKTIQLVFGQNDGAPGFPLDPNRISGVQIFMIKPKAGTSLIIKNLRGYGSPQARQEGLSSPADRDKMVVPAEWVGKKPPVEGNWVQTLNENFDAPKLNDKLWSERTWWHGMLPGQTQRYSASQHIFENGVLKMRTEKKLGYQYDDPSLHTEPSGKVLPQREYVTGHIVSYNKWTQLYGYFESRVKLPKARGLWPAFWMMPDRGPAAGTEGWKRESTSNGGMEIDILEHLTEWGPGRNNVAVHWDGYDKDHKQWGSSNVYFGPTADDWHTFGLLWEPGKLTWYIDGIKKSEYVSERVGSIPTYLLLNVQMGSWATKDVDEKSLPDDYQIDYVRAWQLKDRVKP